ncbi:hypothetical protein Tcan_11951 [Toxocara canis]|uniref:Uncharacterized protein n=1 Tax=Toxocara canis TaxID=6265 RepID=A0A0B2VA30_TOXCA|nr:hypothetical protein Tcan_11951 [Toxocara canis]
MDGERVECSISGSANDLAESKPQQPWQSSPSLAIPTSNINFKHNRSLRVKSSHEKKMLVERRTSDEELKSLERSSSLIRRTKHLSLRIRACGHRTLDEPNNEDSDCKIT